MNPIVTVILPVYNAERYLEVAIKSILEQTLTELELVVVNDGSTDGSERVVSCFTDRRLSYISLPKNQGYPSAMNAGIEVAKADLIARMDADDVSLPQRLVRQVAFLRAHHRFSLVGTRHEKITPNGRRCGDTHEIAPGTPWMEESWEHLVHGPRSFPDPSAMFRRSDALAVGGYRTYQRTGQDLDLWLRLLEQKGIAATLNETLYLQRIHPAMTTLSLRQVTSNRVVRQLAWERRSGRIERMGSRSCEEATATPEQLQTAFRRRLHDAWHYAGLCVVAGDYRAILPFIVRALWFGGARRENLAGMYSFMRSVLAVVKQSPVTR